jgi:hypothetical protein
MNKRTEIRTALKDMLTDGESGIIANIFVNRESRLWQSELPAVIIYSNQETTTPKDLSSRRYIRTLELTVQCKVEATENVDEDLDDLVSEVETVIDSDQSLKGTVLSSVQTNTEIRIDAEGEKDVGVAIITLECKYIS